ncbi:MAG: hypothetical protein CO158_09915 [Piscirickettsiaceae bacterium CG_4_9_14_3_um_filter_43_564]|nr:FtsQ-type POTRA domain-containing protein [Thiomicrospira sp.]OIP95403.1 MAG: hypothetical protein AUK56_05755 [Thiomicrospira sp. CG2_30_44_34]PIQ03299.1 MAG: hypothetical protein COW74_07700 [Piscirickettsiaceae bacterium CG18_big_fil_WC_8_21_14_2_50_44_103]PIU37915.1 MAG: hypothetical protein COT01_09395 [Piscirickettsiaceae bacterium CG07_land_8_20_14_0_80_44_28]PIW58390.1 MAG: hypothetical protein COW14_01505 [Piscirickettsiaceae bacterium CG12_big_fil_rev_8_21_14_0_65_44_934]PIW77190.
MKKLALFAGIIGLMGAIVWVAVSSTTVLSKVQLRGKIQQLSPDEVQTVIKPYLGKSFWRVDLEGLHADLVRLEWVYQAQVTRRWPNQLRVALIEQTPVARWQEDGLLNQVGEIFYPHQIDGFQHLVKLDGEPLNAAKILQTLATFQHQFDRMDWHIEKLAQQTDQSWQIDFLSGSRLLVDDALQTAKITRFIRAYNKIDPTLRKFAQVYDLRYSNGFVIKRSNDDSEQHPNTQEQANPNRIEQ